MKNVSKKQLYTSLIRSLSVPIYRCKWLKLKPMLQPAVNNDFKRIYTFKSNVCMWHEIQTRSLPLKNNFPCSSDYFSLIPFHSFSLTFLGGTFQAITLNKAIIKTFFVSIFIN